MPNTAGSGSARTGRSRAGAAASAGTKRTTAPGAKDPPASAPESVPPEHVCPYCGGDERRCNYNHKTDTCSEIRGCSSILAHVLEALYHLGRIEVT